METLKVTKVQKGAKVVYMHGDDVLRTSKRDYKYALFGLCFTKWNEATMKTEELAEGEWRFVGLGNDAKRLLDSWKSIWKCSKFRVVTVQ